MTTHEITKKSLTSFLTTQSPKFLLALNTVLALVYFVILLTYYPSHNRFLFFLLIAGEIFHLAQLLGFVHTAWHREKKHLFDARYTPMVDVFITVAGEPVEVVRQTAMAAKMMDYPRFRVWILNDGYVAQKDNWYEIVSMARTIGVSCITRRKPGGAKAGNINHALKKTRAELVAVFDADHIPHADFLKKMVGYFADPFVGFAQSPQYYKNAHGNYVAQGAWEQQSLFFGPICVGKNNSGAAFMCGTNMVMRRDALVEVGGMCETNIAEDFLTSLFVHERGWRSLYVPEVLAEGLAPEDFLSYYKQQFRWARGSLEVIFRFNPLFRKGLKFTQKIQYLTSASYYLSGIIVLLNIFLPIWFFVTGQVPMEISTMAVAAVFLPYIFVTLYALQVCGNFTYTFRALSFSIGSFSIFLEALYAVLRNKKSAFSVTSKEQINGRFMYLVTPHLVYIGLVFVGFFFAVSREGLSSTVVTNLAWAIIYIALFTPFIRAAYSPKASLMEGVTLVRARASK